MGKLVYEEPSPLNQDQIEEGFRLILKGLGIDPNKQIHFRDTPKRAAKAWYNELCKGLTSPAPKVTTFASDVDEMVVLRDIPVRSLCSHHLLPFYGTAAIGYVPGNGKILGLSKLSRIVDYWARRPQVQEDLTAQVADHLAELVLGTKRSSAQAPFDPSGEKMGGVGVVIKATHMCMTLRGVCHSSVMVTSAMRGVFGTNPSARAEYLTLIAGKE